MNRLSSARSGPIASAGRSLPASVGASGRITVCYPLAGDYLGGSHVSMQGLLNGLDRGRYRRLVVPEIPGGILSRFFSDYEQLSDPAAPSTSFEHGRPFGLAKFARTMLGLGNRVAFLRANGVDIVHTNDGLTHATWALAAKLAGVKLVWHQRGDPRARGIRYLAPILADKIVSVSRFAMPSGSFGAFGDAEIIHSPFDVPEAVDRASSRNAIAAELGCPPETLICGYFGTFVDRKRPLEFVETIVALRKMQTRPVLGLMFGEGGYPELEDRIVQRISEPDVGGSVRRMGFRSPGHEWIAGCDVLLVPAVDEPLGRTLVEAMLVGTPVVAADSGGSPEALDRSCGVLVPPDDPDTMAKAIVQLHAEPENLRVMIERARRIARERFSYAQHCAAIEQIYAELVRA